MTLVPAPDKSDKKTWSNWLKPQASYTRTAGANSEQQGKGAQINKENIREEQSPAKVHGEAATSTEQTEKTGAVEDPLLAKAIILLQAGVKGDKEAVVEAHNALEKLYSANPQSPLVQAYYGSAICLLGRDAIDYNIRLAKALEGLKLLDKSVKEAPGNIQVRMLRATVCYRLPETFFHRTKTAIEDFNYLVCRYQSDHTVISEEDFWQVLYNMGSAYKNTGREQEARDTWTKLLDLTIDPEYITLLQQEGLSRSPRI